MNKVVHEDDQKSVNEILNIIMQEYGYSLSYYGLNDYSTRHNINVMIEHRDELSVIIGNASSAMSDLDTFKMYLFLCNIRKIGSDCTPYIVDDYKEQFLSIVRKAKKALTVFNESEVLSYVSDNYLNIINSDGYIIRATHRYVSENISRFSDDFILQIIHDDLEAVLNYFDSFRKRIISNNNFIDAFCSSYT